MNPACARVTPDEATPQTDKMCVRENLTQIDQVSSFKPSCSFDAAPRILRLYGQGRLVFPRDAAWAELRAHFDELPGERQIVVLDVESVQTSCGFGVPRYEFKSKRRALQEWAQSKGEEALAEYRRKNNRVSIDGLVSETVES
jgi:hypothetical protein